MRCTREYHGGAGPAFAGIEEPGSLPRAAIPSAASLTAWGSSFLNPAISSSLRSTHPFVSGLLWIGKQLLAELRVQDDPPDQALKILSCRCSPSFPTRDPEPVYNMILQTCENRNRGAHRIVYSFSGKSPGLGFRQGNASDSWGSGAVRAPVAGVGASTGPHNKLDTLSSPETGGPSSTPELEAASSRVDSWDCRQNDMARQSHRKRYSTAHSSPLIRPLTGCLDQERGRVWTQPLRRSRVRVVGDSQAA